MAGPNGFWRVGGYTAQGCEVLTYHPHTHTPITTPRAKRFEHGVRPSADDFSTKAMSEPCRTHTDAHACFDAHAMPQHCNPNRPNTHTQPPVPPSATSRDGFWTCAVTPAARSSEMNATQPSPRRNMEGIKLSRQSQPPCLAHTPAAHSRSGVDVSGNIVDAVDRAAERSL
jgi:hypothetical protein